VDNDVTSISTHTCPTTGLRVTTAECWQNVPFGKDYRSSFFILGSSIIHSQPVGYIRLPDVQDSLRSINEISRTHLDRRRPFVLIEDFSQLKGVSLEARRYYISRIKRWSRMIGLVFYGASPGHRISIKLGTRLNITPFKVRLVDDYEQAVRMALELLPTLSPATGMPVLEHTKLELTPRDLPGTYDVERDPAWGLDREGFSLRYEVLKKSILHSVAQGQLREDDIAPIAKLRRQISDRYFPDGGFQYYIVGTSGMKTVGARARRAYVKNLSDLFKARPFCLFVFYGANRLARTALRLARPFAPFRFQVVRDLDDALKVIAEDQQEQGMLPDELEPTSSSQSHSDKLEELVDEVLEYIASINWELDDLASLPAVDPTHPFSPVFDAIRLIKGDLDELMAEHLTAQEERRQLEAKLQHAQKMEALGALAGGVAHDLNNILSGLVGYPEMLLMDLPNDPSLRETVLTIKSSGEKAATIVHDLLTLARRGIAASQRVDLNHVVRDYLSSPDYRKLMLYHPNVEVSTQLSHTVPPMIGSPVHLLKIVMNLVSNAAEAMPDGGSLTISTRSSFFASELVGHKQREEGEYIVLEVADTGIGISHDDQARIFEPFYTKKVLGRSGTGLGMAVVWATVEDHNGFITVQSSQGAGSTFTLLFPVAALASEERLQRRSDIADLQGGGESILIIDDQPEQRAIGTKMLSKLGYSVTSVGSGEEAVEYLLSNDVHLILLDMIMDPGIGGLETYRRILEHNPHQRAIITSGFSESADVVEALNLGASTYVGKPFTINDIGTAVREELNRQRAKGTAGDNNDPPHPGG